MLVTAAGDVIDLQYRHFRLTASDAHRTTVCIEYFELQLAMTFSPLGATGIALFLALQKWHVPATRTQPGGSTAFCEISCAGIYTIEMRLASCFTWHSWKLAITTLISLATSVLSTLPLCFLLLLTRLAVHLAWCDLVVASEVWADAKSLVTFGIAFPVGLVLVSTALAAGLIWLGRGSAVNAEPLLFSLLSQSLLCLWCSHAHSLTSFWSLSRHTGTLVHAKSARLKAPV